MLSYLTDQLLVKTESTINERAKYTANTGIALINTANTGLTGTGTITKVITGASNGTLVQEITVQALGNTTKGMIRLFIYNPFNLTYYLLDEIDVPAVIQSSTTQAFSITYEVNYYLQSALSIYASTENAESFVITAEGLNFTY